MQFSPAQEAIIKRIYGLFFEESDLQATDAEKVVYCQRIARLCKVAGLSEIAKTVGEDFSLARLMFAAMSTNN